MPSCLIAFREISDTVTFTITWSRSRSVSELITVPLRHEEAPPTKALAMSTAWVASEAFGTTPTSRIESPAGLMSICEFGRAVRSVCLSTLRSRPTLMSSAVIC